MLRRTLKLAGDMKSFGETLFKDRTGRFNLEEAAKELNLDGEYVRALYKPRHYTFYCRGQRYPAENGRSTRPGGPSSNRRQMFPLYRRNPVLDKQLNRTNASRFTSF